MVTIDRINSDYTIFYDDGASVYRGMCNKCGGTDASASATKSTVQQAVVDLLTSGGIIYLKAMTLDGTVTFGSTILIIEDYQGVRKLYSNTLQIAEFSATAEFQSQSGAWAAPSGSTFEGRTVLVYNSTQVALRQYFRANSKWWFSDITGIEL